MSGPYPLATLACTISSTGISSPSYADIYASLQASAQAIYGTDIYLDPDSQDGQQTAIYAQAQYDSNQATIAAFNNYSPATSQGVGLSSAVKINGLQRETATQSTADLTLTGTAGTLVTSGVVGDDQSLGTTWMLPATVTIGSGGTVVATATCSQQGAITAAANTLTSILTPTAGWQSVTNGSNASIGAAVEDDAQLRQRQSLSTSLPAQTPPQAIYATVANVSGVTRPALYENDSGTTDGNGVPGHSICLVIEGGNATAIAQAIESKKTPGCGTYGSTSETVEDPAGVPITINFDVLGYTPIYVSLTIAPLTGYTVTIGTYIQAALAQAVNSLAIGGTVYYNKLWAPANLSGDAALAAVSAITGTTMTQPQLDVFSATYNVTALTIGTAPSPVGTSNITITFNYVATCTTADVVLTT